MAGTGISTGTFGRLPRAAPDLSGAIASLLREAQAQYDNNFVDAWKNGGKVDGKGVTDTRLLDHMKSRLDGLAKDDPLYDEWQNRYTQYHFNIEESKMALKNDQGKLSDAGMAQFYKDWAAKPEVQKDSEFYRSLLSRSAKWDAAAKSRAAGNSARAAAVAHQSWVTGFYKSHVQASETMEGGLLAIAKEYGAASPNATKLDQIDANSAAYQKFLDVIDDGKSNDPNVQGIINEVTNAVKATNPNFTWSQSNVDDLMARGVKGLDQLLKNSTSKTETNDWTGRKSDLAYAKTRVKQTAANERIQVAADKYATQLDTCAGDPYCARNATKELRDALQKEVPNVVAGMGGKTGITIATEDKFTSTALVSTIEQLDTTLSGKKVETPAGAAVAKGAIPAGYTIFDAAGGLGSASGWLANTGNGINDNATKLDNGGWLMTQMVLGPDGKTPLFDGNGQPLWENVVGDPKAVPPPGAVAVAGNQLFDDGTRTAVGRPGEAPTNQQRTPTTYVMPSDAQVNIQTPDGTTVDPKNAPTISYTAGGQKAAGLPWIELHGVIGPDGNARTLYRTGDGSPTNPYLFHEQVPVPSGTRTDAAGRPIVTVTTGVDSKGAQTLSSDIAGFVKGVGDMRQTTRPATAAEPNPPYVMGTFSSSGATSTAQAIGQLFHTNAADAASKADGYMTKYQQGIMNLPDQLASGAPNPDKVNGLRDVDQLNQTVALYKAGKSGSALTDAYSTNNQQSAANQGYLSQLAAQGITAQASGQGEVDRRLALLKGIDDAEKNVATQSSLAGQLARAWTPAMGLGAGAGFAMTPQTSGGTNFAQQQADLEAQRRNVFNPTVSVSNIKVPGLPSFMQPGTGAAGAVGKFGAPPGMAFKPPTPYAPPVLGPTPTPPPVAPPPVTPPVTPPPVVTPPKVNTAPPYNPDYSAHPSYLPTPGGGAKPF